MNMRLLALSFALLATPLRADDITIFAAASLKNAMDEIALRFESETDHSLITSFAGSSVLALQIEHGAPADIFISANQNWMDYLKKQDLIANETRSVLLTNRIVLVAHGAEAEHVDLSPDLDLSALLGTNRLSMALVNAVPVGMYGKSALEYLGLWEQIKPQVVQTDNARAALALVSLGEAQFGIVYATDAIADPGVTVAATFSKESHQPILYPVAAMAGRANPDTLQLLTYLHSNEAGEIFKRHGFSQSVED